MLANSKTQKIFATTFIMLSVLPILLDNMYCNKTCYVRSYQQVIEKDSTIIIKKIFETKYNAKHSKFYTDKACQSNNFEHKVKTFHKCN